MRAQAGALLQAGLALKINQIKQAAQSYVRDRGAQGQGLAATYAIVVGLYAAAGIFLVAACLVGVTALFRWIEIDYGLFHAFAASGGILLLLTILCAVIASRRLHRPARSFPSLMSRLRVAITANPIKPGEFDAVRDTAATALAAASSTSKPATPPPPRRVRARLPIANSREAKAGLLVAASLAGWALARRHNLSKADR